jgi:hypothetical protein
VDIGTTSISLPLASITQKKQFKKNDRDIQGVGLNTTIIEHIPFDIKADHLYPLIKVTSGSALAGRVDALLETALKIVRPKVAYKLSAVEHKDGGVVVLDGVRFQSNVLQVNLRDCRRAFPFVATCGAELEDWSRTICGRLESFWADTIQLLAIGKALEAFKQQIQSLFKTGTTSTMNPGSLADWPIGEQYKLFTLLGDSTGVIGVHLTQSAMMVPLKSASGIEFESGEKFYNCQLCPRDKCPGRRAPYDQHLLAEKYSL